MNLISQKPKPKPKRLGFRRPNAEIPGIARNVSLERGGGPLVSVQPSEIPSLACENDVGGMDGLSTGPSPEGRARIAAAHLKHGKYTKQALEAKEQLRMRLATLKHEGEGLK